jgi:hypothetical protein
MTNWTLEVEDVACPVDDMIERKWLCSRPCVQSDGMGEGRTGVRHCSLGLFSAAVIPGRCARIFPEQVFLLLNGHASICRLGVCSPIQNTAHPQRSRDRL